MPEKNTPLPSPPIVMVNNHTVAEIQQLTAALNSAVLALVLAFQNETGCLVHSIPVHQDRVPTRTQVKVQIPGA